MTETRQPGVCERAAQGRSWTDCYDVPGGDLFAKARAFVRVFTSGACEFELDGSGRVVL